MRRCNDICQHLVCKDAITKSNSRKQTALEPTWATGQTTSKSNTHTSVFKVNTVVWHTELVQQYPQLRTDIDNESVQHLTQLRALKTLSVPERTENF